VTQMSIGIFLSFLNALHFKKPYNVFFEFIPQVLFLGSTFGYMCVLMIAKWSINWRSGDVPASLDGRGPPSILNLMIYMFLSPQMILKEPAPGNPSYHLYGPQFYVQICLLAIALLSVPVMLVGKPILLIRDEKAKKAALAYHPVEEAPDQSAAAGHGKEGDHGGHGDHEEFEASEVITHQAIHTIEFVLGSVSNTASYLRLWALSLAHSELSEVFLSMVMVQALSITGSSTLNGTVFYMRIAQVVLVWAAWAVWAALTIGVLLCMESLSAFLHALRLHWVEFQNKFYMGTGYAFAPFNFEQILKAQT